MAGRGPAPKDPEQRRRRNADPTPATELAQDGALRGPELPDLPVDEGTGERPAWHPRTLAWWETWRRSAQAQQFMDTDWDFLVDTALMHHTMWSKGRWEFAAELRLRAAKFGATPEDRARLRMKVTEVDPAEADKPRQSRYSHLKVAK